MQALGSHASSRDTAVAMRQVQSKSRSEWRHRFTLVSQPGQRQCENERESEANVIQGAQYTEMCPVSDKLTFANDLLTPWTRKEHHLRWLDFQIQE